MRSFGSVGETYHDERFTYLFESVSTETNVAINSDLYLTKRQGDFVLVLGFIALLYGSEYSEALGVSSANLMGALAAVVATNGLAEAVVSAIIAPVIAKALIKVKR